ncbi:MAG: YiiX/YebB-like N1pC/P60 family cysteine hydrolase [Bacteroidota bacterium]
MKKALIIIFIVLAVITASFYLFLRRYNYRSEQEQIVSKYTLSPKEISLLKEGDIILRHGYGFVSDMIVETLNDSIGLSHCSILAKDDIGEWMIIHSVSSTLTDIDGVQSQPFAPFINDSKKNSVVVIRYKNAKNDSDLARIGQRAEYYLDKQIPFDDSFDLEDSTKFYCSELLWKVIKDEYSVDIFEAKNRAEHYDYMKFDCFLDTFNFEIILDHRLRDTKKN